MWMCLATVCAITGVLLIAYLVLREKPPPSPTDEEVLAMLRGVPLGDLPPALRHEPPRPDVFSGRGFLKQRRYRQQYLPFLQEGRVHRGLCVYAYRRYGAGEMEVLYEYAWLDHLGKLQRVKGGASFEGRLAPPDGRGDIFLPEDGTWILRSPLTIVCSPTTDEHILYEVLLLEDNRPPEVAEPSPQ